jgi:hypothetical protein
MPLTKEEESYKLPVFIEGSKHFFSITPAKDWNFITYFENTHTNINKRKQFNKVKIDYDADLNWIIQLQEASDSVREYARELLKQPKVHALV